LPLPISTVKEDFPVIRRNQIGLTVGGAVLGLAAVVGLWLTHGPKAEPAPADVVHNPALGEQVHDAYRASVLDGASPELKRALEKPGQPNDLPPIDPNLRTVSGTESADPALPPLPPVPGLPSVPTPVSKEQPAELPELPPLPPPMPKAD
jgi:hypothetical protein